MFKSIIARDKVGIIPFKGHLRFNKTLKYFKSEKGVTFALKMLPYGGRFGFEVRFYSYERFNFRRVIIKTNYRASLWKHKLVIRQGLKPIVAERLRLNFESDGYFKIRYND